LALVGVHDNGDGNGAGFHAAGQYEKKEG